MEEHERDFEASVQGAARLLQWDLLMVVLTTTESEKAHNGRYEGISVTSTECSGSLIPWLQIMQ